jgi:hypothetical protein
MKRHLIYYGNGFIEQASEINPTLERQVSNGIINFIVDTQKGTVFGKSNNPQLPAQWYDIPSAPEPEPDKTKAENKDKTC